MSTLLYLNHTYQVTLDNNEGSATSLDKFVGRAAHISFLDSPIVAAQLLYSLYQYFI